jgi:hypothetical protein
VKWIFSNLVSALKSKNIQIHKTKQDAYLIKWQSNLIIWRKQRKTRSATLRKEPRRMEKIKKIQKMSLKVWKKQLKKK